MQIFGLNDSLYKRKVELRDLQCKCSFGLSKLTTADTRSPGFDFSFNFGTLAENIHIRPLKIADKYI